MGWRTPTIRAGGKTFQQKTRSPMLDARGSLLAQSATVFIERHPLTLHDAHALKIGGFAPSSSPPAISPRAAQKHPPMMISEPVK